MTVSDNTPVLIGVGQFTERADDAGYEKLSPVELGARAAKAALADAGDATRIAAAIDVVAGVRQFEISTPMSPVPFGKSDNMPRSIARLVGVDPARAVLEVSGGQGPQHLVNEFAAEIAAGRARTVLLVGSEAISTARLLADAEPKLDWSETVGGQLEDRGFGLKGLINRSETSHRLTTAPLSYALLENARRAALCLSRDDYARAMGELFAPFTEVAAANPYSVAPEAFSADQLIEVTENNRMIAEPYRRRLVSRDQVNQAAAIILTSVAGARALGVPEGKWVYLHGHADAVEKGLSKRPDLGKSPAAVAAAETALDMANIGIDDIAHMDFYSCFPIAVFNIADGLGLRADDPRGLTITGGLPFFGGAGNNYSMHAIATMIERLRADRGSFGLIGANGGMLSKYSTGVYSTTPAEWKPTRNDLLQAELARTPDVQLARSPEGRAKIVTYTVGYTKGAAAYGIVMGVLPGGERFFALTPEEDKTTLEAMLAEDPVEREIYVRDRGYGNRFTFVPELLDTLYPRVKPALRDEYEFIKVERRGRVLEITINRPDQRNSLHPPAHLELEQVFDVYFGDPELWVAIITGAGTESFCAGNDLKYRPDHRGIFTPKSGFAGITSRVDRNKPLIAAVNGFAMGGGFEISLASDLIVADRNVQFALSEVKVGVIAGAGGIVRLTRQIPPKIATELILTGRRIGIDEATALGLVNRVAEPGQALEEARKLADAILEGSPSSVRLSLQYLRETAHFASEVDAARHPAEAIDELLISADMYEGFRAFAEKRKPNWTGR